MANSKTNWLEQRILLKCLRNTDFTIANAYLGLTAAGAEPVGNGYARLLLVPANWSAPVDDGAGGMEMHYTVDAVLGPAAGGPWGNLDGFTLFDAAVGGNGFYADLLATPQQINDGNEMKVPANLLIIHEA